MADEIKANYSQLEQIASTFDDRANTVQDTVRSLKSSMENLRSGFEGSAATAFFKEMEELVMPGSSSLERALTQASAVTKKIADIMRKAEQEASAPFAKH